MKKDYLKNKKAEGFSLLGNKTINLVLAVFVIVILIIFLFKIRGLLKDKDVLEDAEAEMDEIFAKFKSIPDSSVQREHFFMTLQGWYMFSTEFGDYCRGDFCLCVCKDEKCSGSRMCMVSEKFVLLRDLEGREKRLIKLESPFKFRLFLNEEKVYPYNGGGYVGNVDFWTRYFTKISTTTPLFFKFDTRWLWSPDLANWGNLGELKVKVGQWAGTTPSEDNQRFIDFIANIETNFENSEQTVKGLLERNGATESNGVYILQLIKE